MCPPGYWRVAMGTERASDPQDDKATLSYSSENGMRNSWTGGPGGSWMPGGQSRGCQDTGMKARAQQGGTALTSSDPWDVRPVLSGGAGTKAW